MAQSPEKPSLNYKNCLFDFSFIPWPPWSRWQDGGVIMRGHFRVGTIDLRIVETGLDHRRLRIIRHQ